MKLIVGLGNPGTNYAGTRHNIGFMAIDEIHRRHCSAHPWRSRFQGHVCENRIGAENVLLLKPSTYMNDSGRSVGEAMRFYKLEPEDIFVIYDELDLPPGKFRMKKGGGHGGHNGIRSISDHIGPDYRRLRLGIGHPGDKNLVSNYVLGHFAKSDRDWLDPLLAEIADNASLLAEGKDSQFANKLTLALEPEKAKRKEKSDPGKDGGGAAGKPKGQSHIRQARQQQPVSVPKTGPMADMLKRLLGGDKS
ncbi:aminoacyl-tRNA hydrolase [Roseibium marinum]|uniref:Peptidyl-tRNA hydrolase n=1 Tax=Roseibium marinum TaxID=281252 RepID=A0A2S3UQF9_9HYPH|nr:aminoacyl-tRNA hydrolase [Roseibium marinum]POF29793.1 PTH1 family peptidyl-tRNA hydrolase [Roseibium marinum]